MCARHVCACADAILRTEEDALVLARTVRCFHRVAHRLTAGIRHGWGEEEAAIDHVTQRRDLDVRAPSSGERWSKQSGP